MKHGVADWVRRLFGRGALTVAEEKAGQWSDRKLQTYTPMVASLPGDFAEFGVAFGKTFKRLVPIARTQGRMAHAFDSFEGMAPPGTFDRQEGGHPAGQFNVGGVARFQSLLDEAHLPRDTYRLWAGFIPECFAAYTGARQLPFVIIDVDHYAPTRDSLAWVWPMVPAGGIVMCDDYVANWDMESSRAINEFLAEHPEHTVLEVSNNQIVLRKEPPASTGAKSS